jgi:hypothetical protein
VPSVLSLQSQPRLDLPAAVPTSTRISTLVPFLAHYSILKINSFLLRAGGSMQFMQKFRVIAVLVVGAACASCTHVEAFAHVDQATLAEAVRQYGQNKPPQTAVAPPTQTHADAALDPNEEKDYEQQLQVYLAQKDFSKLDAEARDVRASKSRISGGAWKLLLFYEAISTPASGNDATDDEWQANISTLKDWVAAKPESATALIALAEAYLKYSDYGRGSGYANTVSADGWRKEGERAGLAASALVQASHLKEKCPYWYEAMQQVALAQGWDSARARELFDQAVAFEPDYYHFYREYANYLLPKWYGERGEVEAFAESASNQVGGPYGNFLYFEIATQLTCQCDSANSDMENLSWPKIKQGYADMGRMYGYSTVKVNRFALMAYEAQDKEAAQQAFAQIGANWDLKSWHTQSRFEQARAWALN